MPNLIDRVASLETAEAVTETRMEEMDKKLDRLLAAVIEGNGKPSLLTRVDRLEGSHKIKSAIVWLFVTAIISCAVTAAWAKL